MKKLIFTALLLASANLNAADFGAPGSPEALNSQYWTNYYRQPLEARSNRATIIPQYGGGYTISEPGGFTTYSAPNGLGVINVYRQGRTSYDW